MANQLPDFLLDARQFGFQLGAELPQCFRVNRDAALFHVREDMDKWHFYIVKDFGKI